MCKHQNIHHNLLVNLCVNHLSRLCIGVNLFLIDLTQNIVSLSNLQAQIVIFLFSLRKIFLDNIFDYFFCSSFITSQYFSFSCPHSLFRQPVIDRLDAALLSSVIFFVIVFICFVLFLPLRIFQSILFVINPFFLSIYSILYYFQCRLGFCYIFYLLPFSLLVALGSCFRESIPFCID